MKKIILPILPNRPIKKNEKTKEGYFLLKKFYKHGYVKNMLFDNKSIKYDKKYQNDQSNSMLFRKHMLHSYGILKRRFPKKSKLVEVGCGKGAFLEIVKNDNYFDYKGFDETYEGSNKNIQARNLNDKDRIFADIIVLRHTLEHINSPLKFLDLLKKIFPKNSSIFIEVPQFNWIKQNKVLFDFTYEHVNYFTTKSLCAFFSKTEAYGNFFNDQYQYCIAKLDNLENKNIKKYEIKKNWKEFDFNIYLNSFKKNVSNFINFSNIWIWGGSTKGVLFLKHLADLEPKLYKNVRAVIDINKKKQNFFTPSTNVKIYPPKKLFNDLKKNDLIIVMNPNYIPEVKQMIFKNTKKKIIVTSV